MEQNGYITLRHEWHAKCEMLVTITGPDMELFVNYGPPIWKGKINDAPKWVLEYLRNQNILRKR